MTERLKIIRSNLGLSQTKFAEEMHVSRDVIANYESGRVEPTELFISSLCDKYRINEEWLKFGKGDMHPPKTREVEIAEITAAMYKADDNDFRYQLMKLIAQLSPDQIHTLREIVEQLHDGIN